MLDSAKIRLDFPILNQLHDGKPPIYFDSSCMSLKPKQVVDAVTGYYSEYAACAERSDHWFATIVDSKVTEARDTVAQFIGAPNSDEIVFTYNTTHGINLLAHQFRQSTGKGIVIISDKEHNSNFLPWKMLADEGKITLDILPTNEENQIDHETLNETLKKYDSFSGKKLLSLVYTSNLDGVTFPLEEFFALGQQKGFMTHADVAQFIPHNKINVQNLHTDFITFSGHKMLGPTATGIFWGKHDYLQDMQPLLVGGGTPFDLTYDTVTFQKPPMRFEAGLQHYAGIIGLGAAVEYLSSLYESYGETAIAEHEQELNTYVTEQLLRMSEKISIIGPNDATLRSGIISFQVHGMDHHQVSYLLNDQANIMVRAGRHCVHGYCNSRSISGSVRASFYLYNTHEECDIFLETMERIVSL